MSACRISIFAIFATLAAGALRADLPPEAQSAMRKGVLAGQQQDYPLALRYFEEARRAAPEAAEIYFNLGLTESKIPGRELRAMAWFGAYLAAYPSAPNAAAIRDQLDELEVRSRSATARVLQLAQEAAGKLPENPDDYSGRWQKLEYVAGKFVDSGDIAAAQKIVLLLKNHEEHRLSVLAAILEAQVEMGDTAEARKSLAAIRPDAADSYALFQVARSQLKLGDPAGAKKTLGIAARKTAGMDGGETGAGIIAPWARRSESLQRVIEKQVEAADPAGAEKTLGYFERNKRSDHYRAAGLAQLAVGFAKAGDSTRAKKYVQESRTRGIL